MYRYRVLAALWLATTSGTVLAGGLACPAETIAASDFSLTHIDSSLAPSFGDKVKVAGLSFTTAPHGENMGVVHRLDIAATVLLDGLRDLAAKEAQEKSSESHVYTVGQPSIEVGSDGNLVLKLPVTYTLKAWVKFDWICCNRLKCRKCYKKVWTKVVQKTVDLQVSIEGSWDPILDLRAVQKPVNLRAGDTEQRILHGLNKIFSQIQSGLQEANDGLRDQVEELKLSAIRQDFPQLRGLSPRANAEQVMISFERNMRPTFFGFRNNAQFGPTLSLVQHGEIDRAIFCERLRPRLRETLAYLDSFHKEPVCETIPRGGSLFRLADTHYGNGGCHVALAQINSIRGVDPKHLRPGDHILVPPMYSVLESQPGAKSVRQGDNRWTIARDAGDSSGTSAVGDLEVGQNPDLVFPCQYVLSANDDTLRKYVQTHNVCPVKEDEASPQQD